MLEKSHDKSNASDPVTIAEKARALSLQIEHGQATMPCSDAFTYLIKNANANMNIAFLCLSANSRTSVLDDLSAMGMVVDSRAVVGISGRLHELSVYAATLDEISQNQTAWQKFATGGQILVIATESQPSLQAVATSVLVDLSKQFPVTLIWVTDGISQTRDDGFRSDNRLSQLSRFETLSRSRVSLAELINVENHEFRSLGSIIHECRSSEWLQAAIGNLTGRSRREATRLMESQLKIDVSLKPAASKPAVSKLASIEKEGAKVKESVTTSLTKIDKDLSLKSERSIQPLGKWPGLVREIAFSLAIEDLESTQTPSATRLSVNAGHLAKINRQIEHALRQEMTTDIGRVNRQVDQVVNELFPESDKTDSAHAAALPVLKDSAIWPSVENLIAVGKVFDIELVRKGFFDVLTAGRQKVFMVIMFVSLMGRMGLPDLFQSGSAKVMFGVFMAAVMIGSMINSILLWRSEKQAQSERELAKIRETLFNEALKIVEQVEKAKLTTVREYLKEINLKIEIEARRRSEESSNQQKSNSDDELRKKELLKRGVETRLKLVAEVERQSEKLGELVQSSLNTKKASIQTVLKKWIATCIEKITTKNQSSEPISFTPNVDGNDNRGLADGNRSPLAHDGPAVETAIASRIENPERPKPTENRVSGLLERRRLRELASRKES
jgi:hypothetical protein